MTVLTTPKGKAIFPHLTEADTMFHPEGLFHVKLECPKTESEKIISVIRNGIAQEIKNNTMLTLTKLSKKLTNHMKLLMRKLSLISN